jgi:hypothetical protein
VERGVRRRDRHHGARRRAAADHGLARGPAGVARCRGAGHVRPGLRRVGGLLRTRELDRQCHLPVGIRSRLADRLRQHRRGVGRHRGHRRGRHRRPGAAGPAPRDGRRPRPRGTGGGLRAGRRGAVPGTGDGREGRHAADPVPLGEVGLAPHGGVASPSSCHHARQSDGHPARHHRRHPCVPLGRPADRSRVRGQQARRCR